MLSTDPIAAITMLGSDFTTAGRDFCKQVIKELRTGSPILKQTAAGPPIDKSKPNKRGMFFSSVSLLSLDSDHDELDESERAARNNVAELCTFNCIPAELLVAIIRYVCSILLN